MQSSITENINIELDKICDWLAVDKLSLNASKSSYMIFIIRESVAAARRIMQFQKRGGVIRINGNKTALFACLSRNIITMSTVKQVICTLDKVDNQYTGKD